MSFSAVTCLFIWVFEWLLKRSVNSSAIPEDKGLLGRSEATLPRGLTGNQKEKRAAKVFEPTCTRIFILAINWLTSSTLVQMTSVSMQVQFPVCYQNGCFNPTCWKLVFYLHTLQVSSICLRSLYVNFKCCLRLVKETIKLVFQRLLEDLSGQNRC